MKKIVCLLMLLVVFGSLPAVEANAGCTFGCAGGMGNPVKCGTCSGTYMYMGVPCQWYQVVCIDCRTGELIYEGDVHLECYI